MNDSDLDELLRKWKAPDAPASLDRKVLPKRSRWAWLLNGSIRIPVPVALAAGMALVGWLYFANGRTEPAPPTINASDSVSLAEFQPVTEMKVRVVRRGDEEGR